MENKNTVLQPFILEWDTDSINMLEKIQNQLYLFFYWNFSYYVDKRKRTF